MGKEKSEKEVFVCPVGKFFQDLSEFSGKRSKFHKHMSQSRIEFLKAIRSLVDEKIEGYEKKTSGKEEKKMTKIKVQ